jgi:hypothetical protein
MRTWKWVGLAGVAGVAAAGVVRARKRRTWDVADPEELREKLHDRLAEADNTAARNSDPEPNPGE